MAVRRKTPFFHLVVSGHCVSENKDYELAIAAVSYKPKTKHFDIHPSYLQDFVSLHKVMIL